jgi:hypothetical protein
MFVEDREAADQVVEVGVRSLGVCIVVATVVDGTGGIDFARTVSDSGAVTQGLKVAHSFGIGFGSEEVT